MSGGLIRWLLLKENIFLLVMEKFFNFFSRIEILKNAFIHNIDNMNDTMIWYEVEPDNVDFKTTIFV